MNIVFIKHFFVGFIVYEIPRLSVFRHFPYSGIVYIRLNSLIYTVKPLYKKPLYKKNLFIRKLFTHLVGIQPFPH